MNDKQQMQGFGLENHYLDLAVPLKDEPFFWGAYPTDELAYEAFIRRVLSPSMTNAIVDWTSHTEDSPLLQGKIPGGWIDPDGLNVGGVSRVRDDQRRLLARVPGDISLEWRESSFVTLDAPTWIEDPQRESDSLYSRLVDPLVRLVGTEMDRLLGWLDLIFGFAHGKHVAYYSRYVPSSHIHVIAHYHDVELTHLPLSVLPEGLLARNQAFRMMHLGLSQWEELEARMFEDG